MERHGISAQMVEEEYKEEAEILKADETVVGA